jgi:hypothetical protein
MAILALFGHRGRPPKPPFAWRADERASLPRPAAEQGGSQGDNGTAPLPTETAAQRVISAWGLSAYPRRLPRAVPAS